MSRALALLCATVAVTLVVGFFGAGVAQAAQDATTTSLTLSKSNVALNEQVTITAVVHGGLNGPPAGTVAFVSQQTGGAAIVFDQAALTAIPGTSNSQAAITTSSFSAGSYTISATYKPGVNVLRFAASTSPGSTLVVGGALFHNTSTSISADPATIVTGQPETLTAVVTDSDDPSRIATGFVMFKDNGVPLANVALDPAGRAVFTTAGFIAGTHSLTASYQGDVIDLGAGTMLTLNTSGAVLDFTAPEIPGPFTTITHLQTPAGPIHEGDTVTITAHIEQYGALTPPPGGNLVNFTANGQPLCQSIGIGQPTCHFTLDANWDATITVSGWVAGTYDIQALYIGSAVDPPFFAPSTGSATVSVLPPLPKTPTVLTYTGPTIVDFGDIAALSALLTDADGNPLAGQPVTLSYGSQSCGAPAITGDDGVASCEITISQPTNSYEASADFAGDATTQPAHDGRNVVVTLEQTAMTVAAASANGTTAISATLLEDGVTPIAGRPVDLSFGSDSCPGVVTDSLGVASCVVPTPVGGGSLLLTGTFGGDTYYLPISASKTLELAGPTSLSYTGDTTADYGDPATLTAILIDPHGAPFANEPVALAMGGQTCTATTDGAGRASCTLPSVTQAAGTYPVLATFPGDGLNEPSQASGTFVVTTEESTLAAGTSGPLVAGAPVTLTGTLLEDGVTPIAGRMIALSLGDQSCPTSTDAQGFASCQVTAPAGVGTGTVTATFIGDSNYEAAAGSMPITLIVNTILAYDGEQTADYNDATTLSATLTFPGGIPIAGKPVTFSLGANQHCTGTTDGVGHATCSLIVSQPAGTSFVTADFAGDPGHPASGDSKPFSVTAEQDTLSLLTFGPVLVSGGKATISAKLLEDGATPIAGRTLTLSLGTQNCTGVTNGSGIATCQVSAITTLGPVMVKASFASDGYYLPALATGSATLYSNAPGGGSFVIGDKTATGAVTFWGAQWWKLNTLTNNPAPSAFKGFALYPGVPGCGTNWSTAPGNSSPPPAGPLPAYMAVIVTSLSTKSGSVISGNTVHIVIVKTNAGYDSNPGHAGTGTVVAGIC